MATNNAVTTREFAQLMGGRKLDAGTKRALAELLKGDAAVADVLGNGDGADKPLVAVRPPNGKYPALVSIGRNGCGFRPKSLSPRLLTAVLAHADDVKAAIVECEKLAPNGKRDE